MNDDRRLEGAPPAPISSGERIVPLDVLRGFALLGILLMNIRNFAMILGAYPLPTAYGDLHGANYAVFYVTSLICDSKFMSLFSMLFGAGVVLMAERQERASRDPWHVHWRRMLVLLVFGLAHAWLFWAGDILFAYALCGLVIFWLRPRQTSDASRAGIRLLCLSLAFLAVGSAVPLAGYWVLDENDEFLAEFQPSREKIQEEVEAFQGSWWQQCAFRWKQAFYAETVEFVSFMFWRAGGLMLIGMGLYRFGILNARKPAGFYLALVAAGVLIGLPLVAWGLYLDEASGWDARYVLLLGSQFNYWGSIPIALGWMGLIMLMCQTPKVRLVTVPLAAVGQMALTNYFLQTLICTTLFYGHGLGWFGQVERVGQMGVVAAVWAVQLVVSPLWLRYFRFGPAEWLWRTLTYGVWQPMWK